MKKKCIEMEAADKRTAVQSTGDSDAAQTADARAAAASSGSAMGTPAPDDAVFRDIIMKAAQGNIKYQELYLKYIDLISEKLIDKNEVVYEATFIDDEDQNT